MSTAAETLMNLNSRDNQTKWNLNESPEGIYMSLFWIILWINRRTVNVILASRSKIININPLCVLTAACVETLAGVHTLVCVNVRQCGRCRDRRGQVTETVGPSVVRAQKSSDKFCGIEWSKRKEGEEASQPITCCFSSVLRALWRLPHTRKRPLI